MDKIEPILPKQFEGRVKTAINAHVVDYVSFFNPCIDQIFNFAIAPYCWFIPDNRTLEIVAASDSIAQLTPYKAEEWTGRGVAFWVENIHPDDAHYFLSAVALSAEIHEKMAMKKCGNVKVNIYCRMLDKAHQYRWMLIQFPSHYFNEDGKIESTLVLMTDLSAFNMLHEAMMTVMDNNNKIHQYFKVVMATKSLEPLPLPRLTKREQQIILLMTRGLNTPQIATNLNISYHTVENHKRNLRQKTGTKTSAELIFFVKSNCLM